MATKVSVVLPVRDGAEHLGEALDSLAGQTLDGFEVVIVDDGSVDGSDAIAEEYAARDRRFRVVHQPRAGIVAALERGRAVARGRYIARMDADDVALPERLGREVEALETEGLAACGGRIEYFPADAVRDGSRRYERWINSLVTAEAAGRDVFVECPIPHPTLVVRRDALDAVVGYRVCGWPEDYDLVLRLWQSGARFRNVEQVVLRWRDHPARLSRTEPEYSLDAFIRCKVHHLRASLLRRYDGVVIWGAGPVGKAFARELVRQAATVVAFVDVDPHKIGRTIYGVPVVSPEDAPRFKEAFAVGAVAGERARGEIREVVSAQGRTDGADFVAVA